MPITWKAFLFLCVTTLSISYVLASGPVQVSVSDPFAAKVSCRADVKALLDWGEKEGILNTDQLSQLLTKCEELSSSMIVEIKPSEAPPVPTEPGTLTLCLNLILSKCVSLQAPPLFSTSR